MELISGVEAELSARSYALMLQVVADAEAEIAVYRRWWGERRVDGVLVCDLRLDDPRVTALEELRLPAVVVGGPAGAGGLAHVWSDDAAALVETVEYLVALGHRRIARVAGLADLLHTAVRADAFAAASRRLGLVEAVTVSTDYTGEEGARATRRLLSSPARPTAIVYDNDVMAIAGSRRRPGDGARGARRPVDRGVGRLAAVPAGAPAADRADPGHPGIRRTCRATAPRRDRRAARRRRAGRDRPARPARQHGAPEGLINRFSEWRLDRT